MFKILSRRIGVIYLVSYGRNAVVPVVLLLILTTVVMVVYPRRTLEEQHQTQKQSQVRNSFKDNLQVILGPRADRLTEDKLIIFSSLLHTCG